MHVFFRMALTLGLVLNLAACGTVSHDVASNGQGAGQMVWPAEDDATPMHKGGTLPPLDHVRQVKPGLNKQQIVDLIGSPHFSEGVWGVREWNYLFKFHKPGGDELAVCQFKVLFDNETIARSTYWKPESCAAWVNPPPAEVAIVIPAQVTTTLSSDALFAFDKWSADDIKSGGKEQLDALAQKIVAAGSGIEHIRVIGYTDRLGNDAYNDALSKRRAQTVLAYLQQQGVTAQRIEAEGHGKSGQVVDCPDGDRAEMIDCLAPNRRVEVIVKNRQ